MDRLGPLAVDRQVETLAVDRQVEILAIRQVEWDPSHRRRLQEEEVGQAVEEEV